MRNSAEDFDGFGQWLSGTGARYIRIGQDNRILSAGSFTGKSESSWVGLHLLDFLLSRVTLRAGDEVSDPSFVLRQQQWEGLATSKELAMGGSMAEVFFAISGDGEGLLRWKCISGIKQDSAKLLEIIFNNLTQGMMITDPEGTVIRINPAIYRRMKQDASDRQGKKMWESHEWQSVPESVEKIVGDMKRVAAGESVVDVYKTMPFGKQAVYLRVHMHPVRDHQGKLEYIAIEGIPVTQEVEDRRQLDLQRTLVKTFFEYIPHPVWMIDADGRLLMMNDAYAEIYGFNDSAIGTLIYADRSDKISEQCIRNNQRVLRSGISLESVEYVRDMNGKTRIFHVTKFPIGSEEGGSLVGGVSLEITEKLEDEQKLRETLERFELVSRTTNDLIYDWDLQTGNIKLMGNAFGLYDELKDKEVRISDLQAYIHPEDLAKLNKKLERTIKDRQRNDWHVEFRIRDRDNGYLHVMDRSRIHRDENGMAYRILGSIQDISPVHEMNKRLQEDRILDHRRNQRVSYEVAERERVHLAEELHDQVNPLLAAARLHISVSESNPGSAAENLAKSKSLILEAIDLIRNMSQRMSVTLVNDRALDDIIRSFLKKHYPGEAPLVTVTGKKLDAIKDRHFKLNVLRMVQEQFVNTLQYAKAGKFHVDLSLKNGKVHLRIEDDGVGFDTSAGYTGLGFSNIQGRVEAYGGKMRITSSPGKGCKLSATFPMSGISDT